MLSVIILRVIMLSVIIQSVVELKVVVPYSALLSNQFYKHKIGNAIAQGLAYCLTRCTNQCYKHFTAVKNGIFATISSNVNKPLRSKKVISGRLSAFSYFCRCTWSFHQLAISSTLGIKLLGFRQLRYSYWGLASVILLFLLVQFISRSKNKLIGRQGMMMSQFTQVFQLPSVAL